MSLHAELTTLLISGRALGEVCGSAQMQQQNLKAVLRCDMPDSCNTASREAICMNADAMEGGPVGPCVSRGKQRQPVAPGSLTSVVRCSAGVARMMCAPGGT